MIPVNSGTSLSNGWCGRNGNRSITWHAFTGRQRLQHKSHRWKYRFCLGNTRHDKKKQLHAMLCEIGVLYIRSGVNIWVYSTPDEVCKSVYNVYKIAPFADALSRSVAIDFIATYECHEHICLTLLVYWATDVLHVFSQKILCCLQSHRVRVAGSHQNTLTYGRILSVSGGRLEEMKHIRTICAGVHTLYRWVCASELPPYN